MDQQKNLIELRDLTVQLKQTLPKKNEKRYTMKVQKILFIFTKLLEIAPQ